MSSLEYTILIATRNRPEALRLSIPRMLGQSCPPSQLVVIDSSEDHAEVQRAVEEAVADNPIDLVVQHSGPGLTHQRNRGLALVRHPVVFFPDDDSIWYPEVAAATMEVYAHDPSGRIAAVCAAETKEPPPGFSEAAAGSYRMRAGDRLRQKIGHRRTRVEKFIAPDPARLVGHGFFPNCELSEWMGKNNVVRVEWMTGFRMSFRTEVIREVGFDEALNAYSLFEDIDASFGAWRRGCVVAARKARVFHYKSPERREAGRRLGVTQILNKAYVVAKHTSLTHPARQAMRRFARYKTLQYLAGARGQFGRERLAGALAAAREMRRLLGSPPERCRADYEEAMGRCLPAS